MKKITLLMMLIIGFNACKTKDVTPAPKADFIYTINDEGSVNFQSVSTNATSFYWQFDGTGMNSRSFDYKFSDNKTYQISLTVKGDGGSDVTTKSISINNITGSFMIYRKFVYGNDKLLVDIMQVC